METLAQTIVCSRVNGCVTKLFCDWEIKIRELERYSSNAGTRKNLYTVYLWKERMQTSGNEKGIAYTGRSGNFAGN